MSELLSLTAAVEAVLARARPLRQRASGARRCDRPRARRARAGRGRPATVSRLGDGRLRGPRGGGARHVSDRVPDRGRPAGAEGAGDRRGDGDRDGGTVPEGADAVVPIEVVREEGDTLIVPGRSSRRERQAARRRHRGGGRGCARGSPARAAQIGAIGAAGLREVTCAQRPRVAIVTTGSELRPPGSQLGPGEIYESNGAMLAAQLEPRGRGCAPRVAADDDDAHREAIERGLEARRARHVGGVSVGPHDLVRRIEGELGVEEVFWGVAVKPGKPVSFGVRGGTLLFGLPGNPVSSLVACALFVVPAIEALQGAADPGPGSSGDVWRPRSARRSSRRSSPRPCDRRRGPALRSPRSQGRRPHDHPRSRSERARACPARRREKLPQALRSSTLGSRRRDVSSRRRAASAHRLRVDDVALACEEAWVTGLEGDLLSPGRPQHCAILVVRGNDGSAGDACRRRPYGTARVTSSPLRMRSMRASGAPYVVRWPAM